VEHRRVRRTRASPERKAKQAAKLAAMRARSAAMRVQMAEKREALKAKQKAQKPDERRKRGLLLLLLALLLLLLFILCCGCGPPPLEGAGEPEPDVEEPLVEEVPPPAPFTGNLKKKPRPDFQTAPPRPRTWLSSFRMQVAARGPRLARCFEGAQGPGTLRWTTSVAPLEGRVSEHTLEPALLSEGLTTKQRVCVVGVLEEPPYKLDVGDEPSTPSRVGMVIEF
jgi:hypothetical protein